MQPPARRVSLSSGELSYFAVGEGRPVLYLHPAGGVRWTKVLDELAKSFKLHVPIMPGFDGTAAHAQVKSMKGLAALAGEFIEKTLGGPCDVIGCSFGGCLAAWLAAERPALVDHLVLECPAGFRPKGKGERPADPEALKKALFLHPEKLPPETKTAEQEAGNRKMLQHYGYAADTDEEARRQLAHGLKYFDQVLMGGLQASQRIVLQKTRYFETEESRDRWKSRLDKRKTLTLDEQIERGTVLCGSPETVVKQIKRIHSELGHGVFNFTVKVGTLPDDVIRRGMELFRDRVLPHVRDL